MRTGVLASMRPLVRPIRRCAHRKTNGIPCGSPALKDKPYCYFHDRWREQHIDVENDSFVSGHDFSRAVKTPSDVRALAPE